MKLVTSIAILIALAACTPQPQAAAPASPTSTSTAAPTETASPPAGSAEPVANGMKYTVNIGSGDENLMIEIGQVLVLPEGLKMGVTVRNESDAPIEFDPVRGTRIVVGDRILRSTPLVNDGDRDVSATYQPGDMRSGELIFPAPSGVTLDVEQIDRVRLYLDDVVIGDILTKNWQMEFKLK